MKVPGLNVFFVEKSWIVTWILQQNYLGSYFPAVNGEDRPTRTSFGRTTVEVLFSSLRVWSRGKKANKTRTRRNGRR